MRQQFYFGNKKNQANVVIKRGYEADKLVAATHKAFMLLGLMALRDQYEWGTVRLERWVDKMNDLLDSYEKGYISIKDLEDTLYEETGIRVN